jgi:hypothetical protein
MSLPDEVADAVKGVFVTEFVTLTKSGVPIDTTLLSFPRECGVIEVTTGLAYPAKANRAKRNPKVGLLFEPKDKSRPTVLMAAMASVRDADIATNSERYAQEDLARSNMGRDEWEVRRKAVWYFARIWIQCTPVRTWWWYANQRQPYEWSAPPQIKAPPSDPPQRLGTSSANWTTGNVQERADAVLQAGTLPHLSLANEAGWPLPMRMRSVRRDGDDFVVQLPDWVPWPIHGPASLTFEPAAATFIGHVTGTSAEVRFEIDRLLPDLPLARNPTEVMNPEPETRRKLLARLEEELALRGESIPNLPEKA